LRITRSNSAMIVPVIARSAATTQSPAAEGNDNEIASLRSQ
jgi:hypothetical protein